MTGMVSAGFAPYYCQLSAKRPTGRLNPYQTIP
jgi:hypothetical protein